MALDISGVAQAQLGAYFDRLQASYRQQAVQAAIFDLYAGEPPGEGDIPERVVEFLGWSSARRMIPMIVGDIASKTAKTRTTQGRSGHTRNDDLDALKMIQSSLDGMIAKREAVVRELLSDAGDAPGIPMALPRVSVGGRDSSGAYTTTRIRRHVTPDPFRFNDQP